jgi:hypothetical protein
MPWSSPQSHGVTQCLLGDNWAIDRVNSANVRPISKAQFERTMPTVVAVMDTIIQSGQAREADSESDDIFIWPDPYFG